MTTANTNANTVVNISITAIDDTIKTYQMREMGLNEQNVESLVYSNPDTWLPVILKQIDDNKYAIVSGFHRVEATKQRIALEANTRYTTDNERANAISHGMQNTTIKANVIPENLDNEQTKLLAYRYNSEHGLQLTIAEKKKYAVLIHLQNGDMPHYKIAQLVHISDKTVTSAIEEYENNIARGNAETDNTEDEETPEDETVETVDFDKRFKAFANQVRKFYNEVISEIDDDKTVASYFGLHFNKQASVDGETPFDGDLEVLKTLSTTMGIAVKRLTPKSEPIAKAPKTSKAATPEATTPEAATPEATTPEVKAGKNIKTPKQVKKIIENLNND